MASLEPYVKKIKPAMDAFLRAPTMDNLKRLDGELHNFNWFHMKIFNVQILVPLVLKLEQLEGHSEEVRTATINCIRFVTSKVYVKEVKGLCTTVLIVLNQIRRCNSATAQPNASEEIKLAVLNCIAESLRRSTSDVLESFYTKDSSVLHGQILLTIVEFMEREKYKLLITTAIECLMVVFYVHDDADTMDVVLRNQVADSLFIYLPKIIMVLFKMSLSDEKLGETIKAAAIKALGRILCVVYEETNVDVIQTKYDISVFHKLLKDVSSRNPDVEYDTDIFSKTSKENFGERLKRLQGDGRTDQWFTATSRKLRTIFTKMCTLRSHPSTRIRLEYIQMCCILLQRCPHNLKDNFIHLLESIVAMAEDEEVTIKKIAEKNLKQLQNNSIKESIFDENAEILFDEHLTKLPRIIHRRDDTEQYTEFIFIKGFLRNLSTTKLQLLLTLPKNMEMFCMCLLSAVDLKISRDLLNVEYSLRDMTNSDFTVCSKLQWRQFKNVSSTRCLNTLQEICAILGNAQGLNRIVYDFLLELLMEKNEAMNETILIMLWMATAPPVDRQRRNELVKILLETLLCENHWHLALVPDNVWRLKIDKPTHWFVDRTPGLYESAIEVRTQDCDSDDENDMDNVDSKNRVTIVDAEFNVLHTCIVLDALGHCATFQGGTFDKYLFPFLHRVLLKVANSNTMIYEAATFTLISIQKALKFAKTSHFIETYTDYITYHLNNTLKRSPDSKTAVDILTVVLQFSTQNALPHLESIFQTIREECSKAYQIENINSYLNVFNAFLMHVNRWQLECDEEMDNIPMQIDAAQDVDVLTSWLNILQKHSPLDENRNAVPEEDLKKTFENHAAGLAASTDSTENETAEESCDTKLTLPHHIEMINQILMEVFKFVSSNEKIHQILALECLISGVPLLKNYENELLPLVHSIWQPLVEKFRQKDAVVLNRCFTLLNILATYAKDFILKRSLDDVIPFLKQFLKEAAQHSTAENITAHIQEYKLQLKLLREFSNLIQCMQIDGKQLNDIAEVITLYLSQDQPKELQEHAIQFYYLLRLYNGPLVYLIVLKKVHLKDYKDNVEKLLNQYGIK